MKYRALRIISTIYKILAWIALVMGVLGVCASSALTATGALALLGEEEGALAGASGIVGAAVIFVGGLTGVGFYVLLLFAVSEGIQVVLALEENTRQMVAALRER